MNRIKALIGLFIVLTSGMAVTFGLSLNYTGSTPANGSLLPVDYLPIQIGIDGVGLEQILFYQDGIGYFVYDSSLVLMMNFDNISALGEDINTIKNMSSDGNDGVVNGAIWDNDGKYGGAYSFDGNSTNNYVNLGDILDEYTAGADKKFSFAVWIKPDTVFINKVILDKQSSCGNDARQYLLKVSRLLDDTPVLMFAYYSNSYVGTHVAKFGSTPINQKKWYHLVVNYDGTLSNDFGLNRITLYVDGVKEDVGRTLVGGAVPSDGGYIHNSIIPFSIGASLDSTNNVCLPEQNFSGMIDELRMYNRVLSSGEIQQLYQSNLSKYDTDQRLFTTNIPTTGKENITISGSITNGSTRAYLSSRTFGGSLLSYISGYEEYPWIDISTSNSRVQNTNRKDIKLEYGKPYVMSIQYLQDLPVGNDHVLNFFGAWKIPSTLPEGEQGSLQIYVKPFYDSKDNFVVE